MINIIKQHKWKAIISSLLILAPTFIGLILWDRLPGDMNTGWGSAGHSIREFSVFLEPVLALLFHWTAILITAADPKNKGQNKKVLGLIFWLMPAMSLSVSTLFYGLANNTGEESFSIVPTMMAIMFIVLGNYMPKVQQNSTFGIKVTWTLRSKENWDLTHRFAGKLWVIGGFVLLVALLLPESVFVTVMVLDLLVLAVVPIIYSYRLYKKQTAEGKPMGVLPYSTAAATRFAGKFSAVFVTVILAACAVLMFTGDISYQISDTSFTINATYRRDITVSFDDIDSIEFRSSDNPGSRTMGFGSPRLLMGTFKNDEFGSYTRYTYTNEDACIVLKNGEDILVIGCKGQEATKELYEALKEHIL